MVLVLLNYLLKSFMYLYTNICLVIMIIKMMAFFVLFSSVMFLT